MRCRRRGSLPTTSTWCGWPTTRSPEPANGSPATGWAGAGGAPTRLGRTGAGCCAPASGCPSARSPECGTSSSTPTRRVSCSPPGSARRTCAPCWPPPAAAGSAPTSRTGCTGSTTGAPGSTCPNCAGSRRSRAGTAMSHLLRLAADPPVGSAPATLVQADEPWGHRFRVCGFPAGHDGGDWASGRLLEAQATRWLQVEAEKLPGPWVQPGYSGAPVWDEQLSGIVGMTVAADRHSDTKVAYVLPTAVLLQACPEL